MAQVPQEGVKVKGTGSVVHAEAVTLAFLDFAVTFMSHVTCLLYFTLTFMSHITCYFDLSGFEKIQAVNENGIDNCCKLLEGAGLAGTNPFYVYSADTAYEIFNPEVYGIHHFR